MPKNNFFETDRLFIRPTSLEDAPFIYNLLNTPKWIEYIGDRNIRSVKDAEAYIKNKMLPQLEKLGYTNNTVIRKSDGKKIGTCGLYNREGIEGVDIGYAFLPEYEKQGYAFESTYKIMKVGFQVFHLDKISAITTRVNKSSQKLLEKLGFTFHKIVNIPNDHEKLLLYIIDSSIFKKTKIL